MKNAIRGIAVGAVAVGALAATAQAQPMRTPVGLDVSRHALVLHSVLPHCAVENGSTTGLPTVPCTWNVGPGQDGDGTGAAYWVGRQYAVHYVWPNDPRINHPGRHWVTRELADALAEGSGPHADTRSWERCWFTAKGPERLLITVGCPNGQVISE